MVSYADEEGGLASRHREVYDVERDLFNSINARQYEFEQLTTDGRRRTDHRFLVLGVLRDMGQMLTAPGSPLQAPRSRLTAQGSPLKVSPLQAHRSRLTAQGSPLKALSPEASFAD